MATSRITKNKDRQTTLSLFAPTAELMELIACAPELGFQLQLKEVDKSVLPLSVCAQQIV